MRASRGLFYNQLQIIYNLPQFEESEFYAICLDFLDHVRCHILLLNFVSHFKMLS